MNDVYCSIKFTDLTVHVQSRLVYNCCNAYPERIDIAWLEQNPGKLFHTPTMIQDRTEMLAGKKCKSCEFGCYQYEDQGQTSRRTKYKKNNTAEIITDVFSPANTLDISLSNDCNLTCAYCTSEWSSAWTKDLIKNGEYEIKNYNNKLDNWSKIWNKTKQQQRSTDSKFFQLILKEIELAKQLKKIGILGGEPLLHNQLFDILEKCGDDKQIKITTGLGISEIRLKNFIEKVKNKKNIQLVLSCDAVGSLFEFIRYGASWAKFNSMYQLLKSEGIPISFYTIATNLNSFGIKEFYDKFHNDTIGYGPVADRSFLQPNVLDDTSK
jgi:sulfatase maturation enzyme AslB (radical SAM superfamily)